MDLNKTMLIGRLTRDPDARVTTQGQNVSSFSVATNYVWKDAQGQKQEKPEYHNVVAWARLAEICNQYLKKGHKIYIEGRLQTRSWQDTSGNTRYRTEIIAENMIMLDRPSEGGNFNAPTPAFQGTGSGNSEINNPAMNEGLSATLAQPEENTFEEPPKEEEIKLEDIPF